MRRLCSGFSLACHLSEWSIRSKEHFEDSAPISAVGYVNIPIINGRLTHLNVPLQAQKQSRDSKGLCRFIQSTCGNDICWLYNDWRTELLTVDRVPTEKRQLKRQKKKREWVGDQRNLKNLSTMQWCWDEWCGESTGWKMQVSVIRALAIVMSQISIKLRTAESGKAARVRWAHQKENLK